MAASNKQQTDAGQPLSEKLFSFAEDLSKRAANIFWPDGSKSDGDRPLMLVHPVVGPSYTGQPVKPDIKDMEEFLAEPLRIREKVNFLDLESFIGYVKRHSRPAQSVIFLNTVTPGATALLDYHSEENDPSWCTHVASYAFPTTKEWDDWNKANGVKRDQTTMGLFLEEHLEQILSPEPAELLQTVMRMKEVRKVTFGQAQNLQNGMTEFQYVEEGDGGSGSFQLPQTITLGMAPYRDGEKYKFDARMRYRCDKNEGLLLWFDLVRPDRVIESAVADVRAKIIDETHLPLFAGTR